MNKPRCEEKYRFRDAMVAPTWLGDKDFIVKEWSMKSKLFQTNEIHMIVFVENRCWTLIISEHVWTSFVRPSSWFVKSDYFVVSIVGQELAHREWPTLGNKISVRRCAPMWVDVMKSEDGFVQFSLDSHFGLNRQEYRIPVGMFHDIFQKAPRASLEGYIMRKNDIYRYGKPCNLNEMKHLSMKPIGVTPADFKRVLAEIHPMKTSVHVEFDFKTDEDRLKAIEFLQKMKVQ